MKPEQAYARASEIRFRYGLVRLVECEIIIIQMTEGLCEARLKNKD